MKVSAIDTGFFKLDGGAMYGVVPKTIWNKFNPADENNMCNWAMRCLLVETGNRKILIDTGIGTKQSDKFYSYYFLNGTETLLGSLSLKGLEPEDITDVILTHLHFDHVGGAVIKNNDGNLVPTFPNATYHVSKNHWDHACFPNAREKASFLGENFLPLQEHGVLRFADKDEEIAPGIWAHIVGGHTVDMICPKIETDDGILLYAADLFPSSTHIPVNYVMGYDIEPLVTMEERQRTNEMAFLENWNYFLEHDHVHEVCKVARDERGRFRAVEMNHL
ncbi:MBL fold metallo-hydrolase [Bacteroidia bacterium]|nr:MBL fold metallo-hydrolase [Bacteroidia bacterium]